MTHDQRNAAIRQMMKTHARTVAISKDVARDFLIEAGFYKKDGQLSAKYGGSKKAGTNKR